MLYFFLCVCDVAMSAYWKLHMLFLHLYPSGLVENHVPSPFKRSSNIRNSGLFTPKTNTIMQSSLNIFFVCSQYSRWRGIPGNTSLGTCAITILFFSSISWLQYKFWLTTLCANHTQWTFCIECPLSVLVHVQCTAFFISGACSYHMQSFCNIYQNTMWRKLWKCSILWLYRDPKTPQNVGNLHPDCITCGPCGDWHFMVSGYTRLTFLIMNNMYGRLADRYT